MVCEVTPLEVQRKELERLTMLEGTRIWQQQKEANIRKDIREKREVRQLLENYWPWGRPGGGAPNSHNVGLRNVYLEEIYPNEEIMKAKRQVGAFQFGRPGGGAPHVNKNGQKQIRFREDPALRFQFGQDLRRAVDNTLRYRSRRDEQQQYKQQLDALVEEKKRARDREIKKKLEFERKMGWTTDKTIQRIQDELSKPEHYDSTTKKQEYKHHENYAHQHNHDHHHNYERRHYHDHHHDHGHHQEYEYRPRQKRSDSSQEQRQDNGIELVPLIIKRRPPAVTAQLGTTDVTRGDAMPHRSTVVEPKYYFDLSQQVQHKSQRIMDDRMQDVKGCQEHFKTWGSLWGRPGHGARRELTRKGHLMSMLYPQMQPMPVH